MSRYPHRTIDEKWQRRWDEGNVHRTPTDRAKPKLYVLDMFPYPSGAGLHVGHPKGYVATDVVARARRMMGTNVLRVMGWDSFGLPAERQAVREGRHPREITARNIARFKKQMRRLGLSYDWSREIATSDPSFYRWTQWIFLKLYDKGLAYQIEAPVNFCPALGTVLANEEVKDGVYVETGDPVERRLMKQWMLRITAYAERLLGGLEDLDWPESIQKRQRDWIGRSEGVDIRFRFRDRDETIEVFTTRPDTIFGATALVLAPEHPLLETIVANERRPAVERYRKASERRTEKDRQTSIEKTGVDTGAVAIHPMTGDALPVWIGDYVLPHVGTGAIFLCPAHDERDHAFAKRFDLAIREVIAGGDVASAPYLGDGPHVRSEFLNGMDTEAATRAIIDRLERDGSGSRAVRYKLRDWLFSRQRYWGEPIPVIELDDGTLVPLSEDELPLELPELDAYEPTPDGQPPLARATEWMQTTDPTTGRSARRQANTMPQWAGSCWYYLRFLSPHLTTAPWDPDEERYWMPVDLYVGGAEHAVLHLLYARFWHHVLYDLGLVSTPEPFRRLVNQGMIHHPAYRDERGKYYPPEVVEERDGELFVRGTDIALTARREKMSKSKSNVVVPDALCEQYGADAVRLYELFMGPLEDGTDWDTAGVSGTRRFLDRVWRLSDKLVDDGPDEELERVLHRTIEKVTASVEDLGFNTAIAQMMAFVNEATKAEVLPRSSFEAFVRVLFPFAPHLAEELWERLGHEEGLSDASWPPFDPDKLAEATVTIAVQVDGKTRATVDVAADADRDAVLRRAKRERKVARHLEDRDVVREIYVPGRLANFVTRNRGA